MLIQIILALVTGLLFGGAAALAIVLGDAAVPAEGMAPPDNRTRAITVALTALEGAWLGWRGTDWSALATVAIIDVLLIALWQTATRAHKVPNILIAIPIAAIALGAVVQHDWSLALGALLPFGLFAAVVLLTRTKRGLDWEDAKIAALVGGLVGTQGAIVALSSACVAAAASAWLVQKRDPIALVPYMLAATFLTVVWKMSG
jgi:hypothetical protein